MKQTDDEKDEKISIRELLVDSILNSLNHKTTTQLTIGSYVSVRSSRYEARGKFGEHSRS